MTVELKHKISAKICCFKIDQNIFLLYMFKLLSLMFAAIFESSSCIHGNFIN